MTKLRTLLAAALSFALTTAAHAQTQPAARDTTSSSAPAPALSPPKVSGYIQVRETFQEPVGFTATLNRARATVEGALPNRFTYRLMAEYQATAGTAAAGVSLRDALVRWSAAPWSVVAGQFKTPFSREYLTSITMIETLERAAVVDTLAPKRDIGVMGEWALGSDVTVLAGVFNGSGQNVPANRDSVVLVVARATARPISELNLGGSVAAYEDSTRYGLETSIERSGLILRGELIGQRVVGRSRDDLGWFALVAYRVLPALQLVAKQEDFQRPAIGVARRITATTAGFNLDLGAGRTRLSVNQIWRTTGATRQRAEMTLAQLQVRY